MYVFVRSSPNREYLFTKSDNNYLVIFSILLLTSKMADGVCMGRFVRTSCNRTRFYNYDSIEIF